MKKCTSFIRLVTLTALLIAFSTLLSNCVPNNTVIESSQGGETAVSPTATPFPSPTSFQAAVTREVLPPQPSATPAVCTPLAAGMFLEIVPQSETAFTLNLTGFPPGDSLIFQLIGRISNEGAQLESMPVATVSSEGKFSSDAFDLGHFGDIKIWQGKVIHSMGVACFDITLPLPPDPVVYIGADPSEPTETAVPTPIPTPPVMETPPDPTTTTTAPEGLIFRSDNGEYWHVDAAGEVQQVLSATEFVSFNPIQTLAAYVPLPQDGSLPHELAITDLRDQTTVRHVLDVFSIAGLRELAWLDETTLVLGVFNSAEDEGPNAGYPALVDTATGAVTILDKQNKMTTPPAVNNGRILYSVTKPAPLIYQWQNGVITQLDSAPFLPMGLKRGDSSLFSPALATDGKQAWWGKPAGDTGAAMLFIYSPAAASVMATVHIIPPPIGGFPDAAIFNQDGSWLAFEAWTDEPEQAGIYLVATDGSRVIHLGSDTHSPLWLDGTTLAYTAQANNLPAIHVYALESGETAVIEVEGVTAVTPFHMRSASAPAETVSFNVQIPFTEQEKYEQIFERMLSTLQLD